ncbi:hypothetical protein EDB85DRAFT_551490 [Lactarius pseudohatsudake]|nr:hypothetical protein EDB85DRAFT_551490 [Lactarius pseudohatsudake]
MFLVVTTAQLPPPPITLSRSGPSSTSHHHPTAAVDVVGVALSGSPSCRPSLLLSCCRARGGRGRSRRCTATAIAVAILRCCHRRCRFLRRRIRALCGRGHGRRRPAAAVVGVTVVPAQLLSPHSPRHHPHRACCSLKIELMHTPPPPRRCTGLGLAPRMMVVAAWGPHSTVGPVVALVMAAVMTVLCRDGQRKKQRVSGFQGTVQFGDVTVAGAAVSEANGRPWSWGVQLRAYGGSCQWKAWNRYQYASNTPHSNGLRHNVGWRSLNMWCGKTTPPAGKQAQ